MIKPAVAAAAISLVVGSIAALSVTETDAEVREQSRAKYCEGVAIWRAEARRGIDAINRAGRPEGKYSASDRCPNIDEMAAHYTRQHNRTSAY